MKAVIISVGTELLLGDVVDTNAAFLSRELALLGISVYTRVTVGDNVQRLTDAFTAALQSADLVIATGGLGPTEDDLTREAAAACFGVDLRCDDVLLEDLKNIFARHGSKMTDNNIKQSYLPDGAVSLKNPNGTAPGVYMEKDRKMLALLPGPPRECEPMFADFLRPILEQKQDATIVSETLKMTGIGESAMETLVRDLLDSTNPTVAPYAGNSEVHLRVTARAASKPEALAMNAPVKREIYTRLSEYIYGESDASLEEAVVSLLKRKGLTLAVAESCTGGLLAGRITAVPGCSEVFNESFVTYSNEAKIERINVPRGIIETHGAVSYQCAEAMAAGVAKTTGASAGLAITGIAGPGGGTQDKPIGLVYIGIWIEGKCDVIEMRWSGSRERIRQRAVAKGLEVLWRKLKA